MAGTTTNGNKFMLRKDCGDIHRRQISWWISITAILVSIMLAYGGISYALSARQSDKISVLDRKTSVKIEELQEKTTTHETQIGGINETLAEMRKDIFSIKKEIIDSGKTLTRIETRLNMIITEQESPWDCEKSFSSHD